MRLLEYFHEGLEQGLRLHQFIRYAVGVYRIGQLFSQVTDGRRDATIRTFDVVQALFMAAILRVPSVNALEGLLGEPQFQRLLGHSKKKLHGKALFSADTIMDVLDTLEVRTLQLALVELIKRAERNRAFRDDTFGTFITVAIDGWEPFSSYDRHCEGCLTRKVKRKTKNDDGEEVNEEVIQYYHRFVVAMMIAPKLDMVLAIEPILSDTQRRQAGASQQPVQADEGGDATKTEKQKRDEAELTAALRLIDRLHEDYGCFIDAFALDGLYPCGPVFTKLKKYRYGGFIVTKNKRNEPYRTAYSVWCPSGDPHKLKPPERVLTTEEGEKVEFWRENDITALGTYDGAVDMMMARVTRKNGKKRTWTIALVGKAKRAPWLVALRIMRARWHIENTAFHQWVTKWNLDHCYRHTPNAINVVINLWALAFNLMQLFFYRRLNKPRRGRKAPDTIANCIRGMWLDLGSLDQAVPWHALLAQKGDHAPTGGT